MGIKSTRKISRDTAIERITVVNTLIREKNWIQLFEDTHEGYDFDNDAKALDWLLESGLVEKYNKWGDDVSKWSNDMLEHVMDEPFYRFSGFDNYVVVDKDDEE